MKIDFFLKKKLQYFASIGKRSKISLDHFFRRVRTLLIPQTWVIKPKIEVKIGRYRHFIAHVKQECICSPSLSGFSHLPAFSSQLSDSLSLGRKRTKDTKRFCLEYNAKGRYNPCFTDSFGLITQV